MKQKKANPMPDTDPTDATDEVQLPAPKPRKHAELWQAYQMFSEMEKLHVQHQLRISAIERGVSNMSASFEQKFLETIGIEDLLATLKKQLIEQGRQVGPVWDWMQEIRGLKSGKLPAQLLAQIDDIAPFTNVSKLWRFCGFAVIEGEREYRTGGEKAHYNARLKSICFLIADQFIKQRTPVYRDIYDQEKARLRAEHQEPVKDDRPKSPFKMMWTDQHIHAMAMRKMVKIFLQHLWLTWRESEGLPTNQPYAIAILGHADYVLPAAVAQPAD